MSKPQVPWYHSTMVPEVYSYLVHTHPHLFGKEGKARGPFTLSPRQRSPCTPAGEIPCTPFSSHLRWFCTSKPGVASNREKGNKDERCHPYRQGRDDARGA